jgi:hypothetical protein
MRQSVVDGTILVLEWRDSPKKRIGKEQIHVRTREQDRFLAPTRGSLRSSWVNFADLLSYRKRGE